MNKVAANIKKEIKANAPSNTGGLKKNIKHKRKRGSDHFFQAVVYVNTTGEQKEGRYVDGYYWRYLEFGTGGGKGSHVPLLKFDQRTPYGDAQPFIFPVVEKYRQSMGSVFEKEFLVQFEKELAKRAKK